MARHALNARKVIFLGLGLLFVIYFVVLNVFFDSPLDESRLMPLKSMREAQKEPPEPTLNVAQNESNTEKETEIPAPIRLWNPNLYRKYVWLDVAIDDVYVGRVTAELYADIVPKTVENFRVLTTGEKGTDYAFKGSSCHRIIKGFIVQCGDFTTGTGTGGRSIYGGKFDDEPNGLRLKHSKRYILQMANAGPNTNGSQFCFMLTAAPHLNGKHVVFGEVVEGFEVVDKMEQAGVEKDGMPLQHKVSFVDGGEILF
ncbi:peptidyl-prolyl cis-trans isomerase c [Plasmopara halstedii]|uniref:Peptidyl-prolyl cis-trans isomerase n=1 Tax=Plasmopara halstedii TaxID=4781 RepID=A0A0P1AIB4_PLAHL|nr:peptidyl-prolyl cis-trans isomerase c [Plasmopara halstedii]CEG40623.1 peptidyl-prolyl cis-trans isomerase c [Plasmopara halstedii]|eukprot:XP_024576992.1 peptidyl-prolyl cis-trans isomerase c [Plasmopara halstedii]